MGDPMLRATFLIQYNKLADYSVILQEEDADGHHPDVFLQNNAVHADCIAEEVIHTITNKGTGCLVLGVIVITGPRAASFIIQKDNCSGRTLKPGESAALSIIFCPTEVCYKSAFLAISSNDPKSQKYIVPFMGKEILICITLLIYSYRTTITFVPMLILLSKRISPPCRSIIVCMMGIPRPLPGICCKRE